MSLATRSSVVSWSRSFARQVGVALAFSLLLPARIAHADTADQCADAYEHAQFDHAKDALLAARAAAEQCSTTCPAPLSDDCRVWLKQFGSAVPSVIIVVANDAAAGAAQLTLDGAGVEAGKELELDPGKHVARATLGDDHVEQAFSAQRGERGVRVQLTLSHPIKPAVVSAPGVAAEKPKPAWPAYALLGVGAAALATSATLTTLGHIKRHELEGSCSPSCTSSSVDEVRRLWWWGSGFAALGVVSLGAAWLEWPVSKASKVSAGPGLVEWSTSF